MDANSDLRLIIKEVWDWLLPKYQISPSLEDLDIQFEVKSMNEAPKPYCRIYMCEPPRFRIRIIGDRNFWRTYTKKTVGVRAEMIDVSTGFAVRYQLVHELTHLLDYLVLREDYQADEVRTTKHEIEFAFEHYYHYFKQCDALIDKRKLPKKFDNPNKRPNCIVCS